MKNTFQSIGVKDFSSLRHGIAKGPPSESTPPSESGPVSRLDLSQDSSNSIVPWTIVNRYYTADVHFETRTFAEFVSHHASGVPAVIYAWSQGEVSAVVAVRSGLSNDLLRSNSVDIQGSPPPPRGQIGGP